MGNGEDELVSTHTPWLVYILLCKKINKKNSVYCSVSLRKSYVVEHNCVWWWAGGRGGGGWGRRGGQISASSFIFLYCIAYCTWIINCVHHYTHSLWKNPDCRNDELCGLGSNVKMIAQGIYNGDIPGNGDGDQMIRGTNLQGKHLRHQEATNVPLT